MKRLIFFFIVFSSITMYANANESYNSLMVEKSVEIDGNLSEWNNIEAYHILKINDKSIEIPTNKNDLSAYFMSFSNGSRIYLGIRVFDDVIVTGKGIMAYDDDCIEILLYKTTTIKIPIKIWCTLSELGKIRLEGRDDEQKIYPLLMQRLGILAGFQKRDDGYDVEISMPASILQENILKINQFYMNILVYDNDRFKHESILQCVDLGNNEKLTINYINAVEEQNTDDNSITVELSEPKIINLKEEDLSKHLETAVYFQQNRYYKLAEEEFLLIINNSTNSNITLNAKYGLALNYYLLGRIDLAESMCNSLENVNSEDTLSAYISETQVGSVFSVAS